MERRATVRNEGLGAADLAAPLFVPADRPDRIVKATERGARSVVIDLEDAVAPDRKGVARENAVRALADQPFAGNYLVRVNTLADTHAIQADLAALQPAGSAIAALILPKITSAEDVRSIVSMWTAPDMPALVPTVETALGIHRSLDIASASPAVHTLLFGPVDLSAELGVELEPDGHALRTARSLVVLACAGAGVAAPIDGPWTTIGNDTGLKESVRHARSLGFGGKVAIHPTQLPLLHDGFRPSPAEVQWATEVVSAYDASVHAGIGAIQLGDGTFIDPPVAVRARRILAMADPEGSTR